jgi:exosortase D (VPLPA-CTERM-specific)
METQRQLQYDKKTYLGLLTLLITFFICYWETLAGLFHIWSSDGDYSYAFLIPFISGYIIWERRKEITTTPISTNWIGGSFFFLFLIISVYGILGSSPSAVRSAIPLIILSITLFCYGKEVFKALGFPLSLLIFMIPLPTMFGTMIGVHLKSISTLLGEMILRLFGISVFVEGNVINLGVTKLQVVDACSGLRYILPLFAIGVVFAYFFEKARWKQFVLAVSTIPIAVISNGIRIGITGILAQKYGSKVADGFFHGFSGWLIFMFAFALLFVFYSILSLIFGKTQYHNETNIGDKKRPEGMKSKNNTIPLVVCSSFLLFVGILSYTTATLPPMKIKDGFSNFPLIIKEWKGRSENIEPEMITASGAEEAFSATYQDRYGSLVSLYMGYRSSPFLESENFFHSPYVCLPSSGWKTLIITDHKITKIPHFSSITVRKMLSEKMGRKQLVYFWFQTNKRTSFDVNINRFHLALHAILRDNTHDLFIRPITPVKPDETIEEAEERMDQFVRDMMSALLQFLSEKQEKAKISGRG